MNFQEEGLIYLRFINRMLKVNTFYYLILKKT